MKFLPSEELKRRQKKLRDKIVLQENQQIIELSNKINKDLEKISTTDPAAWYLNYTADDLKDYSDTTIEEVFLTLRGKPANYSTEFEHDYNNNGRIISARIQW